VVVLFVKNEAATRWFAASRRSLPNADSFGPEEKRTDEKETDQQDAASERRLR